MIQHCLDQRAKFGRNLYAFIGTDSISVGGKITYYTVVAFRHDREGVHFIYSKEKIPTPRHGNGRPDIYSKLHKEFELTMVTARELVDNKVFSKDDIVLEFDYNGIAKTHSSSLISVAKGWAAMDGYPNVLSKCSTDPLPSSKILKDSDKYEYILLEFDGELVNIDQQIAVKAANHMCKASVSGK